MKTELDTATGNLVLVADPEERQAIAEETNYDRRENVIHEALHERYEFVRPEEIGALTDAPILCACEDTTIEDSGDRTFTDDAAFFWFPNYAVEDPWQTLADTGRVTFEKARG